MLPQQETLTSVARYTGAILAGGKSSRMGSAKQELVLPDGRTILDRLVSTLLEICPSVIIVGESGGNEEPSSSRVTRLADLHPGFGPLSGMEALFASGADQGYVVTACDQPLLTASLLGRLFVGDPSRAHLFRASDPGSFYPFPGYYPASMLPLVSQSLKAGRYSVHSLLTHVEPEWIPVADSERSLLFNMNTPEELETLRKLLNAPD